MNRYKYLLKNIGLMTLSSFATKLLSFFLVPLYTNILSTTEYGIYDLFNTTVGILYPILTLCIGDAIMRFTLDKKRDKSEVLQVGLKYLIYSSLIIVVLISLNQIFTFIPIVKTYSVYFILMYFTQAVSSVILSYARGTENIAKLSISSIISVCITIGINILFLIVFKMGLPGYFLANVIGPITQCAYLVFATNALKGISLFADYAQLNKAMTQYSKPLIANSVAWWVNNASDRYIVILFCGLPINGIYSIASKIPSILNIVQTIFGQAWTLSAVKDFDPEDNNGFFRNTYSAYNCILVIICSVLIGADKILSRILYAKDFYAAWQYVPWLTIAIVFGSLSGYLGGFFSAVRNSRTFATSTVIGAVVNLALNIAFTPLIGAMGAAIATAICYAVVWIIRLQQSRKYIKIKINIIRDSVSYAILGVQSILLLILDSFTLYGFEIASFLLILVLYRKDINHLAKKIKEEIKKRHSNA